MIDVENIRGTIQRFRIGNRLDQPKIIPRNPVHLHARNNNESV
jgi:hypothetical protein